MYFCWAAADVDDVMVMMVAFGWVKKGVIAASCKGDEENSMVE